MDGWLRPILLVSAFSSPGTYVVSATITKSDHLSGKMAYVLAGRRLGLDVRPSGLEAQAADWTTRESRLAGDILVSMYTCTSSILIRQGVLPEILSLQRKCYYPRLGQVKVLVVHRPMTVRIVTRRQSCFKLLALHSAERDQSTQG